MKFRQLLPTMDLSKAALIIAGNSLPPDRIYHLYVGYALLSEAIGLARELGATVIDHPFAPYINVVRCNTLGQRDWCLTCEGYYRGIDPIGSEGI